LPELHRTNPDGDSDKPPPVAVNDNKLDVNELLGVPDDVIVSPSVPNDTPAVVDVAIVIPDGINDTYDGPTPHDNVDDALMLIADTFWVVTSYDDILVAVVVSVDSSNR
jgi:hypothetical protein